MRGFWRKSRSAGPAVPTVGYEDVELLDTYSRQTPSGEERSSQPVVKSVLHNAVLKSVLHNPQMGNALFGGAGLVFFVAVLVFLSGGISGPTAKLRLYLALEARLNVCLRFQGCVRPNQLCAFCRLFNSRRILDFVETSSASAAISSLWIELQLMDR